MKVEHPDNCLKYFVFVKNNWERIASQTPAEQVNPHDVQELLWKEFVKTMTVSRENLKTKGRNTKEVGSFQLQNPILEILMFEKNKHMIQENKVIDVGNASLKPEALNFESTIAAELSPVRRKSFIKKKFIPPTIKRKPVTANLPLSAELMRTSSSKVSPSADSPKKINVSQSAESGTAETSESVNDIYQLSADGKEESNNTTAVPPINENEELTDDPKTVGVGNQPNLEELRCDKCNKKYKQLKSFHKHKCHTKYIKIPCPVCSKLFSKSNITHHLKIHSTTRFKCQDCKKTFEKEALYEKHRQNHHTTPNKNSCNTCGKIFTRPNHLIIHLKKHGNKKEAKKVFKCKFCDLTFPSTSGLKVHLKEYHLDAADKCELCGKAFFSEIGRRNHMKAHNAILVVDPEVSEDINFEKNLDMCVNGNTQLVETEVLFHNPIEAVIEDLGGISFSVVEI